MQKVPRLIEQFVPLNYNLSLLINRLNREFSGIVTISGESKTNDRISFHSKKLRINSITVDGHRAKFSFSDNDSLDIYGSIPAGDHIIVIEFAGNLSDSLHGMYPCTYELNGNKEELIATQFESHHAREVFPCIDEPEAKATYDLTLTTEAEVTVLSNTPIKFQRVEDDGLVTSFETTPKMSSYLLAWVIGKLHSKSAKTKNGVDVSVWATPAQPDESLDFALDIAKRSIEFFDGYFGVSYPLKKCDHVALPDFGSGAMENWGLITYREVALLANPKTTSISSKHYIASVIAHELSHQWFGNLVTMKWWNDLWLNESFATMVEYVAIDALQPDWQVWQDFASYEAIISLQRDSLEGVQPVRIEVNHPDEIGTLFDGAIVYAKGARLLKMLQRYIGDDAFRAGLKKYFEKFAYDNTDSDDLWWALGETSDKDIRSFMDAWLDHPGFPVVHVSRDGNEISLSQVRLTSRANDKLDSIWPITINSNYSELPVLFDKRSETFKVSDTKPIRLNVGSDAHFVTRYENTLLKQIIGQIESGEISPIDRLEILNEQIILSKAGIVSSAELIPIVYAYKVESVEAVWDIISMAIGDLKKFVENDSDDENRLRSFVKNLAKSQFDKLGWEPTVGERETDTKLRSTIIGMMIYSADPEIIEHAYEAYRTSRIEELNPELRSLILTAVVRHYENEEIIENLVDMYKTTQSPELKNSVVSGLTSTKNPRTIDKLLNMIKDTDIVKTQDTFRWFVYLIGNRHARQKAWDWLRNNWGWIEEKFGDDKSYDDFPRYAANGLRTHKQLDEYKNFFEPMLSNPALTRVIKIGINEISDRVNSIDRDSAAVKKVLLDL